MRCNTRGYATLDQRGAALENVMKLTYLYGDSGDGGCPRIYLTDRGTLVAQGARVDEESASTASAIAADETLVEIPTDMLLRAADLLRERAR
ncbi:MAG: hypothetical protein QOE72_1656 [Chloroflexota bacterium]|jgi:hypothetical protein|nr:hypothetical protein [Chloroflexota bacterium]